MPQRVVIAYDPNGRHFHLPIRISNIHSICLHPQIVEANPQFYRNKIGEEAFQFMMELFATKAVDGLHFFTHSFSIFLQDGTDGMEIIERILVVLRRKLGSDLRVVRLVRSELFPSHYHPEDTGNPNYVLPR